MRIKNTFVRLLLCSTFVLAAIPVSAGSLISIGIWGHEILPDNPVAGESIFLRIDFSGCSSLGRNADGDSYWVSRTDNQLHFFLIHGPPTLCGTPPPGPTIDYELGNLGAGEYVLNWYIISDENRFPANPDDFVVDNQTSFGVAPAPFAVPLLVTPVLVLLALSLLILGLFSLRKL